MYYINSWIKMPGNFVEIFTKFRILGVVDTKLGIDYWSSKKFSKNWQNCQYVDNISTFFNFLGNSHTPASSFLLSQLRQSTLQLVNLVKAHKWYNLYKGKRIQTQVKRFKLNPWQLLSQLCSLLYMNKHYSIKYIIVLILK